MDRKDRRILARRQDDLLSQLSHEVDMFSQSSQGSSALHTIPHGSNPIPPLPGHTVPNQSISTLPKPSKIPNEIWLCFRDDVYLCAAHTKADMIGYLKEQCQYFSILTESPNSITGSMRFKSDNENSYVRISLYPIRKPKLPFNNSSN